jgi:hypothetical protein
MNITSPKLGRRYPAVVQWSDAQLGDRIATLHRGLSTLADRHSEFVEGLRPIAPTHWTDAEII